MTHEKTLSEILQALKEPVPEGLVSVKDAVYYTADYIHHVDVRNLLDERAPGWWSKVQLFGIAGKVYVVLTLIIHGSDGTITREGIGNAPDHLGPTDYGDPSSNAHAMALRRAAMEFGLFREGWRKHEQAASEPMSEEARTALSVAASSYGINFIDQALRIVNPDLAIHIPMTLQNRVLTFIKDVTCSETEARLALKWVQERKPPEAT
jgi:hypothetical protein